MCCDCVVPAPVSVHECDHGSLLLGAVQSASLHSDEIVQSLQKGNQVCDEHRRQRESVLSFFFTLSLFLTCRECISGPGSFPVVFYFVSGSVVLFSFSNFFFSSISPPHRSS